MTILPGTPPGPTKRSVNTRLVAVVAAGALVAGGGVAYALGVFGGSSGTTTPPAAGTSAAGNPADSFAGLSGAQIVALARTAALHASGVHMTVVDRAATRTVRYSDDDYRTGGIQRVTTGAARAEVRVVGTTTYFTGNRAAITGYFGMPPSAVPGHGVWFRLRPGDTQYKTVTEGVTLASAMREVALTGPYTVLPAQQRHGLAVVGVRGQVPAVPTTARSSATLWVAATGPKLPVEFDASAGPISMTVTFTQWGHTRHVAKPTHVRAVPKGAIGASPQADAQMKVNLRDLATAEETYLTDVATSYATANQLKTQDISYVKLSAGQSVVVHLNGNRGYCLAGLVTSGRYFIYSSEEGGLSGPVSSDTCSASFYPQQAGVLH